MSTQIQDTLFGLLVGAVGMAALFHYLSPNLNELIVHFDAQVEKLETEYAARYKTDLELIDECVADGLKRYRCVMELKR